MGWLFMESTGRFDSPQHYLDDQFTFRSERQQARVLRSEVVGQTYYAAVELTRAESVEVIGLVCLLDFNPAVPTGSWGYKDMDEAMGPNEAACPARILDLLTPTTAPYAIAWRERCRANLR
ncbi:hypothetical protein HJG53_13890 [Sphingomonas sp. ID1715]|uniref:hypothetical protein n=1 Tax=Sphingomonas sp. ID1715 TaxID=1656898 RepID=UPI0014885A4F|nr:hypothetical protein [Sphingomonas sp. ID1715]NNM77994.1 hypothetical protein [Sphingomonas sp. ID1715]